MAARPLRIGTRGSPLALAQAGHVRDALAAVRPSLAPELVPIPTTGDRLQQGPLASAGGKGLFVKEIEEALQDGRIDCAVHSLKDLPAALAPGLVVGAIPTRADPRDVLVAHVADLLALPPGSRVGTASVRRRAQLLARRPDLAIVFLRGNVDTRLRKWRDGEVDAIVLAAAGLARLGVHEPAARPVSPDDMLPAIGQGALALECRADDAATRAHLRAVADADSEVAIAAERGFLLAIGGDCNTPLAAHARVDAATVHLAAMVIDPDGGERFEDEGSAACADAETLGATLATRLLARGAGRLLGR